MRTDNHGIEVRAGDGQPQPPPLPGDPPDALEVRIAPPASGARAGRTAWWLVAVAAGLVMLLAAVVVAVLALARGADEDLVRGAAPAAVQPAPPAPLTLAVQGPGSVSAGEVARFSVTWSDGSGTFSGSTEDWGDEIGTSSRKQGRCEPGEAAPPAAAGTYEVDHAWTAPGTYTVVLGVASYVCENGAAVVEEVAETRTVTVLAAAKGS